MRVQTTTLTTNDQYLASPRALESVMAGVLSQGNGTTNYGKVKAGTVLARSTSSKELHPCGHQVLTNAISAANVAKVADSANFYVGDTVSIYAAAATYDSASLAVGDDPSTATVTAVAAGDSRIKYAQTKHTYDPDHPSGLYHLVTDDGTDKVITVYLEMAKDSHHWVVANDGGGNTAEIIVTAVTDGDSRIKVKVTDPSAASQALKITVTDDGTDVLLDVSVATNGGSAITTTVQQLMDILEGTGLVLCALGTVAGTGSASQAVIAVAATAIDGTTSGATVLSTVQNIANYVNGALGHLITMGTLETAADLGATLAATALTGGLGAKYAALASARTITAINAAVSPRQITFDGAAVTASAGDHFIKDDDQHLPVGVLDETVSTVEYIDGTAVASDRNVPVRYEGDVRGGKLIGASAWMKQALAGGPIVDPADSGALVQPEHAGFVVRTY